MRKLFTLLTLLVCLCTGAWGNETIFSMTSATSLSSNTEGVVEVDGNKYNVARHKTVTVNATYVSGSAEVYNGKGSETDTTKDQMLNNGTINLAGSGNSYFHATFSTELAEGDVISLSQNDKFYISGTSAKGSSVDFPYTIPANSALIGKTDLYLWKDDNGTKNFSSITITRLTGTQAPNIAFSETTVTLTCATDGATIYYTTDGSAPTTSSASKTTGQTFEIANSCTVRAFAQKGEEASAETTKDCYVNHSDTENFLTILKFNGGAVDGEDAKIWKSTDGEYVLTNLNNDQTNKWSNLEASQDAFKLSHVDGYTLVVPSNVKITKIAFIGKSLYEGYTGTVRVTDFNSNNAKSFIEYPTSGINCLSTIEFEPDASLAYGASIAFSPGGCESAAYIELYGVETTEPVAPVSKETVTEVITFKKSDTSYSSTANPSVVSISDYSNAIKNATIENKGYAGCLEIGSSVVITISLPTGASNASVTLIDAGSDKKLKVDGTDDSSRTWAADATNGGYTTTINIPNEKAGSTFTIAKKDAGTRIHKITLTYSIGSDDKIILTTTANMAGWRAFYDASTGYTVDNNTKIYIVTAKDETKATLAEVTGRIPAQTPVLLKTSADNRTMTLTKATSGTDIDATENKLTVTDGTAVSNAYRLGYGAEGVGFYPYSATSPASGIVYLSSASQTPAKALTLAFSDDVTGISGVSAKKAVSTGKRYNLSGQLVGEDYKGIVIENGKKYIK